MKQNQPTILEKIAAYATLRNFRIHIDKKIGTPFQNNATLFINLDYSLGMPTFQEQLKFSLIHNHLFATPSQNTHSSEVTYDEAIELIENVIVSTFTGAL